MSENSETNPKYLPYPKTMQALSKRHGATPGELAVWIMFGDKPGCGGIAAYLDANISESPRRLVFDCWSPEDFDYIAPLMGAWFLAQDIADFNPQHRYIEYPRLIERWSSSGHLEDVEAYIRAKVREDRLSEVHPVTGQSELSWSDREYARPAKETTMLDLADVKAIEKEDGLLVRSNETSDERCERLHAWFEEEQRIKSWGALQRTAEREGIARQTLAGILKRNW